MRPTYCQDCLEVVERKTTTCHVCGSQRPDGGWPVDALIGTAVGGKYRVLRRLDKGAIGLLYVAVHVELEAQRVLKVLDTRLAHDSGVRRRFEREARALYRLDPRRIVRLEDYGEVRPGLPYMALEYVEGETLARKLARGPISPTRALRITRQVAEALVDAAAENVLHRDLRPENVVLREHPMRGDEIKVLDFGIAKILGEHTLSHSGATMRSGQLARPEYVAPETWLGKGPADARADLFSLGVLLFELISGETPWPIDQREPFDVLRRMRDEAPRHLDDVRDDLPAGLADLTADLIAIDPDERPANARRLIERIDDLGLLTTSVFDAFDVPDEAPGGDWEDWDDDDPTRETLDAATMEATAMQRRRGRGGAANRHLDQLPESEPDTVQPFRTTVTAALPKRSNGAMTDDEEESESAGHDDGGPPETDHVDAPKRRSGPGLTVVAVFLVLLAAALAAYAALGELPFGLGGSSADDAGLGVRGGDAGRPDTSAGGEPDTLVATVVPDGMVLVPARVTPIGPSDLEKNAQAEAFARREAERAERGPGAAATLAFGDRREVDLDAFVIDRYEVSMGDFRDWHETVDPADAPCQGSWPALPPGDPLGPARGITFTEATVYCEAAGRRLPTFEEWEAAARGPDGAALPWPGGFETRGGYNTGLATGPVYALSANESDGYLGPAPVTAPGASGYGVSGLGGNVSEWVSGPGGRGDQPPYFHRGGSFLSHPVFAYAYAYQLLDDACSSHPTIGFRCASDAE